MSESPLDGPPQGKLSAQLTEGAEALMAAAGIPSTTAWPPSPGRGSSSADLESFTFGDGPKLADELLGLVIAGRKTATCWSVASGPSGVVVGRRMVAKDGAGRPRAVIETVELTQRRFNEVDEAFARDEGEDDRTLGSWRRGHQAYFTREGTFAPDMLLWCERFRLVEVIGEGADQ